jgi:CBS domain-containing protein
LGHSKDETVKDAIDLLTQNKIISAPVYDDDANQYTNTCHPTVGCSASHNLELLLRVPTL